jgi:aspartyl-tRNA(Asn)/glutamyl-tRNA(Gln) amidotransferase subunit A
MIPDETLYLPLADLAAGIRARRLDPVQLAEAYMDRLQRFGPDLGALVTLTRERALAEARQARDEIRAGRYRGPLHGMPYGAKDLMGAEGYPTTWGAQPYREQRLPDAAVVEKLRAPRWPRRWCRSPWAAKRGAPSSPRPRCRG